jgi:rhodanese-related sulfurtransferase
VPSAKAVLIQTAVIIGVGAAVGLGDLVYRGGRVKVALVASPSLPPPTGDKTPDPVRGGTDTRDDLPTDAGDAPAPPPREDPKPPAPDPQPQPRPGPVAATAGYDCDSMEAPAHWDANHITVARAFDLFQSGQGVFVDARIKQDYLDGHVPNAHFLPVSAFDGDYPDRVKFQMDPSAFTVVYCSGGDDCEAAEDVAIFLQGAGFTALYILHDGMPGWQACGHPVQQGEDPNAF